ncbi:MAG TPA: hypothetical protein VFB67_10925 [Candidatus Polarisedimenticolaceae bacterium]|nr:hypothetical protein [Candidatus Polarisedimenticolaceae bacterium]
MFIGHFAAGLAAKRVAPRASLGSYVAASALLDVVWPVLVLAGVERFHIRPGTTAFSPFAFDSYPWSHSLAMAIVWGAVFGGGHYLARRDAATARMLGAVVVSHWVLDWVTHRPDMPLAPGVTYKAGLSLWNSVAGTLAVETAMFLGAAWWYGRATRPVDGQGRWVWAAFVTTGLGLFATSLGPPPKAGQEKLVAGVGLVVVALFVLLAAWTDRHRAFR